MPKIKSILLDGRTGEGGGQLVRLGIALAALTSQSVEITNVRGNRPRGGGESTHIHGPEIQPHVDERIITISDAKLLRTRHG